MKYLTSEYWKPFDSIIPAYKGKQFEKLIKSVLEAAYGENHWVNTKDSWDGSKDFYYYNTNQNMWAECKNYSSSIGLKVVSPSLVMAQIYDVDILLFFSYSPINENTKSKIAKYADKTFLKVRFFDDIALEKILFNHWSCIGKKYFKKYNGLTVSYISEPIIDLKVYKNPFLNQSEASKHESIEINAYHMFEVDICIINRNDTNITIDIIFDDLQSKDLQLFEINPPNLKYEAVNITVPSYEASIFKIFMTPVCGGTELKLPKIQVNSTGFSLNKDFLLKPVKCKVSKENRLIGDTYNSLVEEFDNEIVYNKMVFTLYGSSGVGKSRLFMECIKKGAANGYIILNYSTCFHNTSCLSVAENLIKNIIVTLYDLSDEVVLEMFNKIAIDSSVCLDIKTLPAFHMIKDFMAADTTEKYIILIDKYIDIICEKIKQRKYMIAVDNVQFFDDSISYFFHKLILYFINSDGINRSRFLLTFNTDYIRTDSLCSELLLFLKETVPSFRAEKIIGFQSNNECEVYLQETLSIGDSFEKDDIEKIINKTNRNPFYLEQMIIWLHEKGVLEYKNNRYIVCKHEALLSKINELPTEIFSIIEQRWNHFIDSHSEKEAVQILSAIHFYSVMPKSDVDTLKLDWNLIRDMEKTGFLSIKTDDEEPIAVYYHDMIENFFSQRYFPLSKYICDHEFENELRYKMSAAQYGLLCLCEDCLSDINTIRNFFCQDTPVKLLGELYYLIYKYYVKHFKDFQDKCIWINDIIQLLEKIRDYQGSKKMLLVAKEIDSVIREYPDLQNEICYGRFLLNISETLDSIGEYKKAHDLILNYKKRIEPDGDNLKQKRFLSEIYNRLHVYRRHQCSVPLNDALAMEYIEKAIQLSRETEFYEMEYVNNSDKGYLYYSLPADSEDAHFTLEYWGKACKVFDNHNISTKTLNYIRKQVQVAMLRKQSEQAIEHCQKGLDYIEYGQYSYQKLFFRWWFHLAMAEGYLQENPYDNLENINTCLNRAQEYGDLLKTDKKYYVLYLRALYFYYKGNTEKAIEYLSNCVELLKHTNYRSKASILLELVDSNKKVILDIEAGNILSDINLVSQITTKDGLFNLICL